MKILTPLLLLAATTLEAGGDAVIRVGLRSQGTPGRLGLMALGAAILFGYGLALNLAPLDWGRLIGAYVATFFVVGQVINRVAWGQGPTLPTLVGGAFIVVGGLIATVWRPN